MRILVAGANGFIGTQIVATLLAANHTVVCGVRGVSESMKRFPNLEILKCDFTQDIKTTTWLPRLKAIDAVVNCVGILQAKNPDIIRAIHYETPKALFEVCAEKNIKVIHISALGADEGVDTWYAKTKLELEKHLTKLNSNWVILRPSLVYGSGSFGGTSLFRALASLPFFIPVVGDGKQLFQPIHIEDLAKTVHVALERTDISKVTVNVVGPEPVSLEQLFVHFRDWLGFGKAKIWHVPLSLIKPLAYLGDWIKEIPINSTSYKMLSHGNTANPEPFVKMIGFKPISFSHSLMVHPSSTQDRWHARLYFLNPLLKLTLGLLWIFSGLIPLLLTPHQESYVLLNKMGFGNLLSKSIFYCTASLDIILGLATIANWRIKWIGSIQISFILLYTISAGVLLPSVWLDPMGSLIKNIPIIIATAIMMALSEQR